jgi:MarR family transcriptional regulator, organic hydroperoxide resistance regulator
MTEAEQFDSILREWVRVFTRRSMQAFAGWMNESGLSNSQIGALMRLHYHGNCRISGMADDLGVSNAAASQMVERLVNMKLLDRTEDPADRRVRQVSLSAAGHDLIREGLVARLDWMTGIKENLTADEQDQVEDALLILISAAKKLEAAPKSDLEVPA